MNVAYARFFTADDYLAWEREQDIKHEYLRGEVYAMAGARDAHVTVSLNVASLLRAHLRGTPCRTFISDMKLRVEAADAFFYPDVFVTCDARDRNTEMYKSHPVLIVEVLSESTGSFDRGRKFAAYRLLDSLAEYVLIDPDSFSVDVFRRNGAGHWVLYPYEGDATVEFASVDCKVALAAVFEDVQVPAAVPPPEAGHAD
jgi:Uma2 family endonuclease